MPSLTTELIQRTYQQPYPPTTNLQGESDNPGQSDRGESYNNFVWALARKFTNTPEEAEAAVQEMLNDIQRCAERGVTAASNEDRLVARIAWRRLLKLLQ